MALTFSIIQRDDQTVFSIRTSTSMRDLPETILHSLAKVTGLLAERGIVPGGPPFAGYFNLDMNDMAMEIGHPIKYPIAEDAEVKVRTIPGGPAGVCLYTGPYQELATAYQQLNAYIESQGCEPTGISYEFYLNDPAVTPPDKLETQIVFPLIQASSRNKERPLGNGRIHSLYW